MHQGPEPWGRLRSLPSGISPNTHAPLPRVPRVSFRRSISSKSQMSPEPHHLRSPASLPLGDVIHEHHPWAPVNLERQVTFPAPPQQHRWGTADATIPSPKGEGEGSLGSNAALKPSAFQAQGDPTGSWLHRVNLFHNRVCVCSWPPASRILGSDSPFHCVFMLLQRLNLRVEGQCDCKCCPLHNWICCHLPFSLTLPDIAVSVPNSQGSCGACGLLAPPPPILLCSLDVLSTGSSLLADESDVSRHQRAWER